MTREESQKICELLATKEPSIKVVKRMKPSLSTETDAVCDVNLNLRPYLKELAKLKSLKINNQFFKFLKQNILLIQKEHLSSSTRGDSLLKIMKKSIFQQVELTHTENDILQAAIKNVMAMIRQLGIPTFFITVSAAESKWNELLCMLKKVVDNEPQLPTEEQIEELTYEQKARLIQKDPCICAQYFDRRFRELKKTWQSAYCPFNGHEMLDYYFRIEFQHRGSPHVHMLVWLADAPTFDERNPESGTQVAAFVDQIISCQREWDGTTIHTRRAQDSNQDTWQDMLNRQTHHHTRTCKRKRGNQWVCRFNIPFYPMLETRVLSPYEHQGNATDNEADRLAERRRYEAMNSRIRTYLNENSDTLSTSDMSFQQFLDAVQVPSNEEYILAIRSSLKSSKVFIQRSPNAVLVNNYSPKIFGLMKSNMDIQFILDPYACCSYIVDYINKADRGMSEALEQVYVQCRQDNNTTAFDMLKSLATTYYNSSEISAQEAAYNILGLRMVESSVVTVFIATGKPDERLHILKAQRELQLLRPESTEIFVPGLIDHYVNRPDQLERITLAQFAAYYTYSKARPGSSGTDARDQHETEDGAPDGDDGEEEDVHVGEDAPLNDLDAGSENDFAEPTSAAPSENDASSESDASSGDINANNPIPHAAPQLGKKK